MTCWRWWSLLAAFIGAAGLGFVSCFLWQWWLLSRPDARPASRGRWWPR
jgi:hypothetical protein